MLNRRCTTEYNSLADVHLQAYFSNRHLLRHLRKVGLINKKREIVPEPTYRANINRAEQKREVKEALAQAIVHKSLDLQLKRESEIQKRLEEIAKLELVKKMRSERQLRKPSATPSSRAASGQHPAWKYFTLYPNKQDSFPASRPRTAHARQNIRDSTPNNIHDSTPWTLGGASERRQFNLKTSVTSIESGSYIDSYSDSTTTSVPESELQIRHARGDAGPRGHQRKPCRFPPKKHGPNLKKDDREELKVSPYLDAVPYTEKRLLKTFDTLSGARKAYHPPDSMANKRTNCLVTLQYLGTGIYILWDEPSPGTEIVIQQQHCGGNTVCVYRGHHIPREEFSFVSHRHLNFPFSLSIYLSGILYLRVSACCEYRHRKGTRLGGPQGLFSLVNVQGAAPCARCQLNRKLNEEKKKKKQKMESSKASEDGQTKVESTGSPSLIEEIVSIEENKGESERENNENKTETKEDKEAEYGPIEFTVSGTLINVEESNSEEDDDDISDYQDDFEDEEEQKEVEKDDEAGGETDDKEREFKEVVEIKEADDVSVETSSTVPEETVPSEKAEEVEEETEEKRGEEVEVVEIKEAEDDDSDETSSTKSEEKAPSEEDGYEDDFHKDDETDEKIKGVTDTDEKIEGVTDTEEKIKGVTDTEAKIKGVTDTEEKIKGVTDTELEANNQNNTVESLNLEKDGKEKENESTSPEDNAENVEEKKDKESVEDLKNEENEKNTNAVPPGEKITTVCADESDSDGRSNPSSSKESSNSSSPLTMSRRKSKMKPERRFRANNRKNTVGSSTSSDSDSIAHLPAELEGTEKAQNWIPASQQEAI